MKKLFKYIYVAMSFFVVSCSDEINREEVTIIEEIVLGTEIKSYQNLLDSMGLKNERFFINIAPRYTGSEITGGISDNEYFSGPTSNIFDFPEFNSAGVRHPSILVPITYQGTNKVIGTIVLLGHTNKPWLFFVPDYLKGIYGKTMHFRQDINQIAFERIIGLYKEKYGDPTRIDTTRYNHYYMPSSNGNQSFLSDELENSRDAVTYTWENKYFDLKIFQGFDLNAIYSLNTKFYKESTNRMFSNPSGGYPDPLKNEVGCYSYSYIEYRLNSKAIEKMKIKKNNL